VVPDISEDLAGLVGYLPKTISLKEVEFQCLPLLRRKLVSNLVQQGPRDDLVDNNSTAVYAEVFVMEFLRIVVTAES
jgi:hypothetical protein